MVLTVLSSYGSDALPGILADVTVACGKRCDEGECQVMLMFSDGDAV